MSEAFSYSLPISGRLRLKFPTFEAVVNRLGRNISRDGIFIPTQEPRSAGTLMALEISLKSEEMVLQAEGEILWTRRSHEDDKPTGMAFRFVNMPKASKEFVEKMSRMNEDANIPPMVVFEKEEKETIKLDASQVIELKEVLAKGPLIGIDFGTTNSCVAYIDGQHPKLIPSGSGQLIIPTVAAINSNGNRLIGHPAKEQLVVNPANTVYGMKRFLGKDFNDPDVRTLSSQFPYEVHANNKQEVCVKLAGSSFSITEICSWVMANIRESAEGLLQATLNRTILTVPAYFSERQRQAVKEAANMAGLQVELLINEPTAAALMYGYDKEYDKTILVFDLGGGTFDVSVLEVSGNVFEVKGISGDTFLGGFDFDQRLIEHIVSKFEKQNKVTIHDNQIVMQRITSAAEAAKSRLSFENETEIRLPFIVEKKNKPIDLEMKVSKDELNELTKDLVQRTIEICGKAIHSMGVLAQDIDDVLLVGGQTRMPLIQHEVKKYFGRSPSKGVHPDEAVALGAAVLAGSLEKIDGPVLLDVLALPIGTKRRDGTFKPLFAKHASLPCKCEVPLDSIAVETGTDEVSLYQGEQEKADDNDYVGDFKLAFSTFDSYDDISLEFELTREGLMRVRAREQSSGKEEDLKIDLKRDRAIQHKVSKQKQAKNQEQSSSFLGKLFKKS